MSRKGIYIVIAICILLSMNISEGSKRKRRTTTSIRQTAQTTKEVSTSTETKNKSTGKKRIFRKGRKSPKKNKVGSAEELFVEADSLAAAGYTTDAMQKLQWIIDNYPDDTLTPKASISLAKYSIQQGKTNDALEILSAAMCDSTIAPQAELLIAKAYAAQGKNGYALLLARRTQIKYFASQVGNDADKLAKSLEGELRLIIPAGNNAKPEQNTTAK